MPVGLSCTRLSLFQRPWVFTATSFILGLLFAARFRFSIRVWMIPSITLWLTALVCLLMKRGGRVVTCLLLILSFVCGGALWALNEAGVGEDRVRRLFDRGELTVEEPGEVWGTLNDAPEIAPDRIYLSVAGWKGGPHGKRSAE